MSLDGTYSRSASPDERAALGHELLRSQRWVEALACYEAVLELAPGHVPARVGQGIALQNLGRLGPAVAAYRQALALRPQLSAARYNLGSCLLELGRHGEAEAALREVLAQQPDHAGALANLGTALKHQQRYDEALRACERALALQPAAGLHHANLGALLRELGRIEEALSCYERVTALEPGNFAAFSDRIFLAQYTDADPAPLLRAYGEAVAAAARPYAQWPAREPAARLRVGLVSADLREHPIGYFLESVLAATADAVDWHAYPNSPASDTLSERLRGHCRQWTPITGLDDEAAARLIHADGLDLLIDLSGHTAGNRLPLFAWKPAPRQATWLGSCTETGVAAIDHFMADPWIAPADMPFIAAVQRLPETFLCFTPPAGAPELAPLPALKAGHLTFGCFNKLAKLNDGVLDAWARILSALPRSRLMLKCGTLADDAQRRRMAQRFAERGIAAERLIFEGPSPRSDYLRTYDRVDIVLDPFPYPGGTTSIEGLWMGVPVLTLAGATPLARQGLSIMNNLGLPEWVATDANDYVARAISLASTTNTQALAELRQGLRDRLRTSPLCDAGRFAGHLLQALQQMAQR
ncbi:tetratricopeptide repeat protein [Pelomonas sp. KK5]|uniref:O-linked N-acetylglucosamine transferase, SPINDLY family protein n=1 Tax=Pelomonas sp. KK5 TaxID=1855730 RepID=UPI00097BF674|nr:tetratricopeptide repeat protein [Pelomonas sp. KK5]